MFDPVQTMSKRITDVEAMAVLTIRRAGTNSSLTREKVAVWLEEQAKYLRETGASYSHKYCARFYLTRDTKFTKN
ncbi:MAG: hypothetical protein L0220_16300 [Acidobacteria bacterium]|nr:hypothetical protein [Acidobacteriota bacterium]